MKKGLRLSWGEFWWLGGWSDVHQWPGGKFPTDEHTKRRDEKVREPTPGRAVVFYENTNIRMSAGIFPVKILILGIRVINIFNSSQCLTLCVD